jgi:hypothetical protein
VIERLHGKFETTSGKSEKLTRSNDLAILHPLVAPCPKCEFDTHKGCNQLDDKGRLNRRLSLPLKRRRAASMAEALARISWLQDHPDVLHDFTTREVDGTTFYVAGCEAFTAEQLGLPSAGAATKKATRAATKKGRPKWKDGAIPYRYVDNFSEAEKDAFLKATHLWEQAAGKNAGDRQTLIFFEDLEKRENPYLRLLKGGATNEASNGAVSSAYLRIAVFNIGSIAHELGHVLGLVHEHQRSDRDEYVKVTQAVSGNANFRKHGSAEDTIRTGYDFGSIMHYGRRVVLDGAEVDALVPRPGFEQQGTQMGQRSAPSAMDIQAVRAVYAG